MNRELLAHLPIVVAVAEKRGFAAAAQALGLSASAVSHAVRVVEDALGEPLFARTTRSVALTEAGERFLCSVGPALEDISSAVDHLNAARGEITGVLKLNSSRVASQMVLPPLLAKLAVAHPKLTVEVHDNDALVDVVAGGFDAGIRLGEQVAQDMVCVRLTPPFKALLVAAPDYLARRGAPARVAELAAHNCIGFRLLAAGSLYDWELREAGETVAVRTTGSAVITDASFARDLALAGVGIAYIFEPLVQEQLRSGRLVQLLPETAFEEPGLFLYFPRRASLAPKLRAFIDAARSGG
ncbi:DNA-binding transcriptional LysR family regulator [Pelomonas saccharophila]|uniref:DNA-binding transcriptional LysR family regulator n=1 Tax=Roseateles saccharophilus TaxID=304 RepID=A0ABU1YQG3_ROSSA|nr:LysR family transcriptional regulator [Roseateles saccharophilus]MDR7271102.1 DNA-binding transcriptional LysR family regulator [Roseateles saccharophilus]